MGYWYSILGKTVFSDLEIPELIPIGESSEPPEFRILLQDIEYDITAAVAVTHRSYLNPEGEYLLEIEQVATYRVRGGREISIMLHKEADMMEVRAYLLGTVLTATCFIRGLIPLHASCVHMPQGAVAIAGNSGAGKSTLAACLAGQKRAIISDDTCAIDVADRSPTVLPTVSRVKLWPKSVEIAGLTDRLAVKDQIQGKFHFHQVNDAGRVSGAVPLKAIFMLEQSSEIDSPHISAIDDKAKAVGLLLANLPRKRIMRALRLDQKIIDALVEIVTDIPIYSLRRPTGDTSAAELVELLTSGL